MSNKFNITPVAATYQNALMAQEIIYTDIRRLGMSHDQAVHYANPTDNEKVDQQYKKLERARIDEFSRTSYFGAYTNGDSPELVALMKLGSWSHGDQAVYEKGRRKTIEDKLANRILNHLGQSHKRGIHHLSAHERLDSREQHNALFQLGSLAIQICDSSRSDIYIPLIGTDPAINPALALGFQETGKTGSPIGTLEQRLFIHKSTL